MQLIQSESNVSLEKTVARRGDGVTTTADWSSHHAQPLVGTDAGRAAISDSSQAAATGQRILVASDSAEIAAEIRERLLGGGHVDADLPVLPLDAAVDRVVHMKPGIVILALSPDQHRALTVMRDIQEMLHTRLLAVGPASDAKLIMQTLREGASQYVDENELAVELPGAIRCLKSRESGQSSPGYSVAILGAGGGCGTSTLAVNISASLAGQVSRCALLDLKLESGDLATLLDVEPTHSLADFCQNIARMDHVMFGQCFVQHSSGVQLLASPQRYSEIQQVTPEAVRKAISLARGVYPFVVADVGHICRAEQVQAIFQADTILLTTLLDYTALRQAERILEYMRELQIDTARVNLIVNCHRRPKELPVSHMEKALDMKVCHLIPNDPKNVNRSNNKGRPTVLERPSAKYSRCIREIAGKISEACRVGR